VHNCDTTTVSYTQTTVAIDTTLNKRMSAACLLCDPAFIIHYHYLKVGALKESPLYVHRSASCCVMLPTNTAGGPCDGDATQAQPGAFQPGVKRYSDRTLAARLCQIARCPTPPLRFVNRRSSLKPARAVVGFSEHDSRSLRLQGTAAMAARSAPAPFDVYRLFRRRGDIQVEASPDGGCQAIYSGRRA
jgi:hypothetical protein